jgi:hypothetical protein
VLLVDDQELGEGAYPIDEARAARLTALTGVQIDLESYSYFLGVGDTGLTAPDRSIQSN